MMEEGTEQRLVLAFASERAGDSPAQFQNVVGNEVGQVGVLGVIPDLFGGVEFRSVRRQPLDLNATAEARWILRTPDRWTGQRSNTSTIGRPIRTRSCSTNWTKSSVTIL